MVKVVRFNAKAVEMNKKMTGSRWKIPMRDNKRYNVYFFYLKSKTSIQSIFENYKNV